MHSPVPIFKDKHRTGPGHQGAISAALSLRPSFGSLQSLLPRAAYERTHATRREVVTGTTIGGARLAAPWGRGYMGLGLIECSRKPSSPMKLKQHAVGLLDLDLML